MRKTGGGLEDDDAAGGRRTGDYRSVDAGYVEAVDLLGEGERE